MLYIMEMLLLQCLFQVLVAVDLPLSDVTVKAAAHGKFAAVLVDAAVLPMGIHITTRILLVC